MKKLRIDQEELKRIISYDPITGEFLWINTRSNNAKAGQTAGCFRKDGYRVIRINDVLYLGHRLAWIYMNGEIPEGLEIDHIDTDRSNNRISNLRLASSSQNSYNMRRGKANASGIKGVGWSKKQGKWVAYSRCRNKKFKFLGYHTDIQNAAYAVKKFRDLEHGDFARHD